MKMRYSLFLIFVFFSVGCKKDKLSGDQEILIGEWIWYSTTKKVSLCNPPSFETELTPITENKTFEIRFFEKGKVEFYENTTLISDNRIVFASFDGNGCQSLVNYHDFTVFLDGNSDNRLQGCISEDSLVIIKHFPFPDPEDACENYTSYFVKK